MHPSTRARAPRHAALAALLALAASAVGCGKSLDADATHKINGAVHVLSGAPRRSAATVNGGIDIDAGAAVTQADTVNGDIRLGARAAADELRAVNGGIALEAGARVAHDVKSVNGQLTLAPGADVQGALSNVNGKIELNSAHVAGGIRTVNGNLDVLGSSRIEGGVRVEKPGNALVQFGNDVPRIVIGPGAVVQGELRFERPVRLYVSDQATIGTVTGTTPIPFSGTAPPP